jgi:hypothetical protein
MDDDPSRAWKPNGDLHCRRKERRERQRNVDSRYLSKANNLQKARTLSDETRIVVAEVVQHTRQEGQRKKEFGDTSNRKPHFCRL